MKWKTLATLGALAVATSAHGQTGDPSGTWLSQSGETRVRIARCGGGYCGTITASALAKDVNNPDATKRDRNLVGVQMISDIKPAGDGFSGQLYNIQDGKTYTGKLKLIDPNAMELSGCVMGGLICRSQTWTKVK